MSTDVAAIVRELLSFHDFTDKTVIAVGAGGGQLATWAASARKVIAVDTDANALSRLSQAVERLGLADKYEMVPADFHTLELTHADVVLFEFSLHEIPDPAAALRRAKRLAPDVVVIDHAPGSAWAYYTAEEQKVALEWNALESFPPRRSRVYEAVQAFDDYLALAEKVRPQGELSLSRIKAFRGQAEIKIPMSYGIALV
jgi:ubiquinone/menaquinone biosynthesis C-methylase UbiE